MIIRIATEGQYELGDGSRSEFGQLEDEALNACEESDEDKFRASFGRLLEFVRANGQPVGDDRLVASDLILPPPDVSVEEARAEFTGEGLIPE